MTKNAESNWEDVYLTPIEESDLLEVYKWQNDPQIRDLTMGFRFPIQMDSALNWIREIKTHNSKSKIVFAIRRKLDPIGVCQLHSLDHYKQLAFFSIYIGDKAEQRKGVGLIATSLLLDYAFNGLGFRKICLEAIEINEPAINLYKKIGFVEEGRKRKDYLIDGNYIDTLIFGLFKDELNSIIPGNANRLVLSHS